MTPRSSVVGRPSSAVRKEWVLGWESRLLLVLAAGLVVFGLASVYAASSVLVERGRVLGSVRMFDQLAGAAVGGLLLIGAARINLDKVRQLAWPIVFITAGLLLILVMPGTGFIAPRINGARRWLNIGISIQVSEIAKLAVVIWTAMLCARKGTELKRMSKGVAPVLVVVLPLALLTFLQPDLFTAVTLVALAMIILFAAGARIGHFIVLGTALVPLLWSQIEKVQYQLLRLTTFFDPGSARQGELYQIDQSLIGIGSGGLLGKGFGQGQQKLGFLPYPYSDFIFSTIGEEWGFVGVVALSAAYLAFVLFALKLARQSGDPFRQYLGVGLAVMIGLDAFTHMAVGLGLVPTTGLVLPFISYGRSGLLTALIATGLIINLGTRRRQKV
jgi:cell division protein FtsW